MRRAEALALTALLAALLLHHVPGTPVAMLCAVAAAAVAAVGAWATGGWAARLAPWRTPATVALALVPAGGTLALPAVAQAALALAAVLLGLPSLPRPPASAPVHGAWWRLGGACLVAAAALTLPLAVLAWADGDVVRLDESRRGGLWLLMSAAAVAAAAAWTLLRPAAQGARRSPEATP